MNNVTRWLLRLVGAGSALLLLVCVAGWADRDRRR